MDLDREKLTCEFCHKEFAFVSSRNRHLNNFHQKKIESDKIKHILCPICPEEEKLSSHSNLIKHLNQIHEISCKELTLHFRNLEEFEYWRTLENREVDYVCQRKNKKSNGDKHVYYSCNRSNTTGFISNCQKRKMKSGGSIKIRGICPSRIAVKIFKKGLVTATFIETHVGHADKPRTKQLTTSQINLITSGNDECKDNDILCIVEPTTNQSKYQDKLKYIKEENLGRNSTIDFKRRREIALQEVCDFGRTLDEVAFNTFMVEIGKIKSNLQKNSQICKKIKAEKQLM